MSAPGAYHVPLIVVEQYGGLYEVLQATRNNLTKFAAQTYITRNSSTLHLVHFYIMCPQCNNDMPAMTAWQ